MKLCVVSFKECWQDDGGAWLSDGGFPVQIAALASLFDATTLVTVGRPPRGGGMPLPRTVSVVPLRAPAGTDARRKLSVLLNLPYYIAAIAPHVHRADVIHVPLPGDLPFLAMLMAVTLRKRLVARYGSSWHPTSQTTVMNRVTRSCMRYLAGDRNVMLATGDGREAPGPGLSWIFATALSEHELQTMASACRRPLRVPMRLVYSGRLSPEKGLRYLLEALAQLRLDPMLAGRLPRLTVIGDGPERETLAGLVLRSGCRDLVRFTGQLPRSELLAELLTADLCVLPSLTEGFCKARLDAMACGVPVLTSDVGFARQIVGKDGERGWVVPPGDAVALADGLRAVLTARHDWIALRERCQAYVQERTLEKWTEEIGQRCAQQWRGRVVGGKIVV